MVKSFGLKAIRFAVGIGNHVAPALTADKTFKMFCTPPQTRRLSEKEVAMSGRAEQRLAAARAINVPYREGPYFDDAGIDVTRDAPKTQSLRCYVFDPDTVTGDTKTMVLIHGWTGKSAFMLGFVGPLLAKGFRVLVVDLPAHGDSSARRLHLPKAVNALNELHEKTGPWHGIIAHSFGGAVACVLASGFVASIPKVPLERLVLIAVPHSMQWAFHRFGSAIGLNQRTQRLFDALVKPLAGRPLCDFESLDMLREAAVPTLLLHAPDDKEVPFSEAENMADGTDKITLLPLPGLGHRRILYAAKTIRAATGFVFEGSILSAE